MTTGLVTCVIWCAKIPTHDDASVLNEASTELEHHVTGPLHAPWSTLHIKATKEHFGVQLAMPLSAATLEASTGLLRRHMQVLQVHFAVWGPPTSLPCKPLGQSLREMGHMSPLHRKKTSP